MIDRGHFNIVEWVLHHLVDEPDATRSIGSYMCTEAASLGDLERIKGYAEKGYFAQSGASLHAARHGHLHALEWLGKTHKHDFNLCARVAAQGGHEPILKWLDRRVHPWKCSEPMSAAAKGGHLGVMRWLRQRNCPYDMNVLISAARKGHLHVLEWLERKGYSCANNGNYSNGANVCSAAAHNDRADVLEWARARGHAWNAKTCMTAAASGPKQTAARGTTTRPGVLPRMGT